MSKNSQPTVIEAIEPRLFLDASQLTETINSSTLPAGISDRAVLHGRLSMTVSNNSGEAQKDTVEVGFLIADGQLSVPAGNYAVLKTQDAVISLANGASRVFNFLINIPKDKLNDGVDTLFAIAVDRQGDYSQSAAGPTLTVHPPFIALSETESFFKLPASAAPGAKLHKTDSVAITNNGSDPSTDPLKIGIYATPDGIAADGTLITMVTRTPTINPGKTVTVPVMIAAIPALAAGDYKLVTQVTQPNGTITATDPSTAPVITVATATVGRSFSDTIISDNLT